MIVICAIYSVIHLMTSDMSTGMSADTFMYILTTKIRLYSVDIWVVVIR